MIIRLLKFFFGYVIFYAEGKFPERFLNLLHRNGIFIWGLRREENGIRAIVRANQYRKLRIPAKKTGMKVSIKLKRGIPFVINRNRYRVGIPIGFALFTVILCILPMFIWQVDIDCTAAPNVDEDLLRSQLSQCGVRQGVFINSVDISSVKSYIALKNPTISWIGVNAGTSRALIDVRASVYPPIKDDSLNDPCNLIAAADGQITEIDVTQGQPVVKVGDAVAKGDMLVNGIVGTGARSVHSSAVIKAETVHEISVFIPFERVEKIRTDEQVRLVALYAFGKEMPLYLKKPEGEYICEFSERKLELFGLKPDISIRNLNMTKIESKNIVYTQEQAEAEALLQIEELERVELRGAQIESFSDRIVNSETGVMVIRTLSCIENIAKQEKININFSQKN